MYTIIVLSHSFLFDGRLCFLSRATDKSRGEQFWLFEMTIQVSNKFLNCSTNHFDTAVFKERNFEFVDERDTSIDELFYRTVLLLWHATYVNSLNYMDT